MEHTKQADTAAELAIDADPVSALNALRFALGDNGKRMFPELVEYAKELYADALKYRRIASLPMKERLDVVQLHAQGRTATEWEIGYSEGWNDCLDHAMHASNTEIKPRSEAESA